MVADLRKMQENQGVSENRIDKQRFGAGILNIGYENQQSMAEKGPTDRVCWHFSNKAESKHGKDNFSI